MILDLSQFNEDFRGRVKMPGIFIISFDCEGKWGVADILNSHHEHYVTNERLNQAYRNILNILAVSMVKEMNR